MGVIIYLVIMKFNDDVGGFDCRPGDRSPGHSPPVGGSPGRYWGLAFRKLNYWLFICSWKDCCSLLSMACPFSM